MSHHRSPFGIVPPLSVLVVVLVLLGALTVESQAESASMSEETDVAAFQIDDTPRMRCRYHCFLPGSSEHVSIEKKQDKPYFDVFATPEGRNILRDAPADHLHHHGMMFAIKIDGVNFWEEHEANKGRQLVDAKAIANTVSSRDKRTTGLFQSSLEWVDSAEKTLAREDRKVLCHVGLVPEATLVDWTTTLSLPPGKEKATLGGNHYHGLGMRFDKSMDSGGRFFSSADTADGNDQDGAGAKRETVRGTEGLTECDWMAYTAKLDGRDVTVAVFDTPGNPRKMRAFTMGGDGTTFAYLSATCNLQREPVELHPDKPVNFRYGIVLWEGVRNREEIDAVYRQWTGGRFPVIEPAVDITETVGKTYRHIKIQERERP